LLHYFGFHIPLVPSNGRTCSFTIFQCLFCLASGDLPLEDREHDYTSKFSLQRHTDRCRLKRFKADEELPCPDDFACDGVALEGKTHFKNHTALTKFV
jgi:hypothetical protein